MRLKQFDSVLVREEMETQLFSLAQSFKAFLPAMAKRKYGKVVVMLTAYTIGIPPKFVADYIICKYALLGLMKAAAAEYCDKGLCINGISPSMIETKFLDGIDRRIIEMSAADSPLKRNLTIEEVITGIEFLMSDENSYMCGTNMNLSGGLR
jgi:3-oxoacyl-[acyl-carrier protein] reductase